MSDNDQNQENASGYQDSPAHIQDMINRAPWNVNRANRTHQQNPDNTVDLNPIEPENIRRTLSGRPFRSWEELQAEGRANLAEFRTQNQNNQNVQHGAGPSVRAHRDYVSILTNSNVYNRRFRVNSRIFSFRFRDNQGNLPLDEFLVLGFNEVVEHARQGLSHHHLLGIKINVVEGYTTGPVGLSFRNPLEVNGEMLLDLIHSVSQSNASFSIQELLEVTATILNPTYGGSRIKIANTSDARILQRKSRHIIDPGVCNDFLCLPKCLILGKFFVDGDNSNFIRFCTNSVLLNAEANKLIRKAGVEFIDGVGCNITSIYKFQKILTNNYSIVVYSDKKYGNQVLYKTQTGGGVINLFYFNDLQHFVVIKDRRKFFGYTYECQNCLYLHDGHIAEHKCINKCLSCKSPGICETISTVTCNTCNRDFKSITCYNNHLITKIKYHKWDKIVCQSVFICNDCGALVDMSSRRGSVHTCNEFYCKLCFKFEPSDHLCYIKKHLAQTPEKWVLVFFDLECTQDKFVQQDTYKHEPDLCISQHVCYQCYMFNEMDYFCSECEGRENKFFGTTCISQFIEFFDDFEDLKVIAISHNLKGYDGMFVLSHLVNHSNETVSPTMIGCKVIRIAYKNVVFIDSYSFITKALSAFPDAFGLTSTKGYFPHFFHTTERFRDGYEGPLPPKETYGTENFSVKELASFNTWYDAEVARGARFNLKNELIKYCSMDVTILRQGCLKFMTSFQEALDINVFTESTTLASAVMLGFRKKFLKPDTLAIIPSGGYNGPKKQSSKIANKWLEYENQKVGYRIIYEYKVPHTKFYVDGFIPEGISPRGATPRGVILEFFGCYYHGCPKCHRFRPKSQFADGIDDRYEKTMSRLKKLSNLGYTLCIIWECEFKKFLKANPTIDIALNNATSMLYAPINVRDAIYGGVVDVFKTQYEIKPGEKIHFLDFKSLYPFTNKTGRFFKRHPRIFKKDECLNVDISSSHGIIKCKILPPQNLFHPVLPVKLHGKMIQPLCRKCAELKMYPCTHSDIEDRALIGTWVLAEVNYAISLNYRIIETYEIWTYETDVYDPITKTGGIFTEYMNLFIKIKEESSGFPRENMTHQEKQQFVEDFFESEGVQLDIDNIALQETLRMVAKLCLNSLWGKAIERSEKTHSVLFREPQEFLNMIASPGIEIVDVICFKEKAVWVKWKYEDSSYDEPIKHQCLTIGALTTAYGRMHLHKEVLSKLESTKSAIYGDTDSIFYVSRPGEDTRLPTGDSLGMLTNELKGETYIIKHAAPGLKCYSYISFNPENCELNQVAKCKGISATAKNMEILTYDKLLSLVNNPENRLEFVNNSKIKRTKFFEILTTKEVKNIKYTFDKRVVLPNNDTVPYGYIE